MTSPFARLDNNKWYTDMMANLAKSGLKPEDMGAVLHIGNDAKGWPTFKRFNEETHKSEEVSLSMCVGAWVDIPIYNFDETPRLSPLGNPLFTKMVLFLSDAPLAARKKKYVQPSAVLLGGSGVYIHMPLRRFKNLDRANPILDIFEGQKKASKAVLMGMFGIGINGCWGWMAGGDSRQLHPDIVRHLVYISERCPGVKIKVRIWPDEDFRTKQDVGRAYQGLVEQLRDLGVEVSLMSLRAYGPDAKYDDIVTVEGQDAVMAKVIEETDFDLPEDPVWLARRYSLDTLSAPARQVGKPEANYNNFDTLLRRHPRFCNDKGEPLLWYNLDTNEMWFGDRPMVGEVMAGEIIKTFQTKLSFNDGRQATPGAIRDVIGVVGASYQRSPLADFYRQCAEDLRREGTDACAAADKELSTWASRYLDIEANDYHSAWGRGLLITMVARVLDPGCFTKTVFIVIGPPGLGKTWVPSVFCGEENMIILGSRNTGGKDFDQAVASRPVLNLDECVVLSIFSPEELKSQITNPVSELRLPYGRAISRILRRGLWYGSSNHSGVLPADMTAGLTRFAVIDLTHTHKGRGKFPLIVAHEKGEFTETRRRLLGAAVLAWERREPFAEVAGAAEAAAAHVRVSELDEYVRKTLEDPLFRKAHLRVGERMDGVPMVGVKTVDIATYLNQVTGKVYATRGNSNPIVNVLRDSFGFIDPGANGRFMGDKNVWTMKQDEFDEEFSEGTRKF